MATAAVFGCTGAVGSHILMALLADQAFGSVKTISRRLPKQESSKLEAIQEADTSKWGNMISTLGPKPTVVFNAVGTTRALAGSLQEQWKIDHDLCVENIRAAKEAGATTYVYISSGGTRGFLSKYLPYCRMKNGVEDAVEDAGFEHGIVLRPGMIVGDREQPRSIFLETLIGNLHRISPTLQDMLGRTWHRATATRDTDFLLGQDQNVIGRAAVTAARLAQNDQVPCGFWVLEQADIVKYGRIEGDE